MSKPRQATVEMVHHSVSLLQVCGLNWCNPAYADGKLFVRDGIKITGELLCLDLMSK